MEDKEAETLVDEHFFGEMMMMSFQQSKGSETAAAVQVHVRG